MSWVAGMVRDNVTQFFCFFTGSESDFGVLSQIINSKVKLYRANVKAPSCEHSKSSEVRKSGNLLSLLDYIFQPRFQILVNNPMSNPGNLSLHELNYKVESESKC